MMQYHARRILAYVILLACRVRSTCCSPDQQFLPTSLNYLRPPLNDTTHPLTQPTHRVARLWSDVYDAIQIFIVEYQKQHGEVIDLDYMLKNTLPYEMGQRKLERIFRLRFIRKANGEDIQQSVLLKVPWLGELFAEGQYLALHAKEKYMYENILPLMQDQTLPHVYFSPLVYSYAQSGTMVVEDLQETGFHVELELHDETLCRAVLQQMAQFHVYSLTRVDQSSVQALDALTVKERDFLVTNPAIVAAVSKFKTYVLPRLPEDVKHDLQDMDREFLTAITLGYSENPDGLNVIVHGDLRPENVLFSADPESRKCKFLDFHESRLGSPTLDLMGYLMSSVQFEVIKASAKELLVFYLAEFEKNLRDSTIEEPDEEGTYKFDELCADMRRHKWFFILRLITIIPRSWGRWCEFAPDESQDFYDFLFTNLKYVSIFELWWRLLN